MKTLYKTWANCGVNSLCWLVLSLASPLYACELSLYPLHFGTYSGQPVQARGAVKLSNCAAPAWISLDAGLHGNGNFRRRAFADDYGNQLTYNLYLDSAYRQIWGDGTRGTRRLQAANGEFSIYGLVKTQNRLPPAGFYQDRVMVIVEW